MNSIANETMFSKIRPQAINEVNRIIIENLDKKVYNVNEAQVWSNVICDEVFLCARRF